ncbi:MFS transporter [Lederbergia lenta]|uniref:Major facilitator family putative sugar symporter n=1 Tax=Lederbergia lenta TaxID=1467 RepID=A0A2X4WR64_LEDLE|nr:MFS transporter [Lederbergia lenta]MEC2322970.1 MFS transporter [Lederbergia lenta]SQI62128.1 major facilitator family putative sugar symporter [Lederbergia lenta]
MSNNHSRWKLKLFLFFGSSISALVVSFLPLYFQKKGITNAQIGMFLALGTFVGLISQPTWGYLSDKFKTVKTILIICLLGVLIGVIWIFKLESLIWVFVAGSFFFFFFSAINPLSDNLSKRIADEQKVSFGSIRSWGSFGFAVISLGSGFLFTAISVEYLSIPMFLIAIIAFILALGLQDAKTGTKKVNLKEIGQFFKDPTLLMFFLLVSFISMTHRTNDSFVSLYLFSIGGDEMLVGWLWFIGVLSEAILFFLSAIWFKAEHPIKYIIFAGFLYFIRWMMTAFITDPAILLSIQVLHGVCFAILFLGAIEYLYKVVPSEMQATGHMVFMGIAFGITGIIGSSLGGMIFDRFSGTALYLSMAASALTGMIGFIIFYYKERNKEVIMAIEKS